MFANLRAKLVQMLLPASHMVTPVPDGYRLVPYKPTPAMKRAAGSAMSPGKRRVRHWVSNKRKHEIRYQAMLDAWSQANKANA